jgi:transmembrane sensor
MRDERETGSPSNVPWDQLTALVAGALPADEAARVHAWLAEDPARAALLEELRQLWTLSGAARQDWDPEAAIRRVKTIAAERSNASERVAPRYAAALPARTRLVWPALAAAAVMALTVGGWWTARVLRPALPPAGSALGSTYSTARGQRLSLKLPDGTAVVLGPESELKQAAGYGARDRIVALTGQAVFTVTHDSAHPFEVLARGAVTRDVGTRFLVRARADTSAVLVAVADGKVELETGPSSGLVLTAGDVGQVSGAGESTRRRGVSLDPYFGWTEGRLVYDRVPLATVIADLARWYDADIRLADPQLGRRLLTASFHDQSVTDVLEMIRASFDLSLVRDGRQFVLAPR